MLYKKLQMRIQSEVNGTRTFRLTRVYGIDETYGVLSVSMAHGMEH